MSYILDALRKSQQTRQPAAGTSHRGAVHDISASLPGGGWSLALGIALLAGILIAAILFWRGTLGRLPDPPASPAADKPATPESREKAGVDPAKESSEVLVAEEASVKKTVPVSDLAEQARVPAPAPPKKTVTAKAEKKAASARKPATAKTVTPAEASFPMADDTPLLQQMPDEFQRALPPLAVTIHVYSQDESQRILFLNNREYRRGSQIEGGVRVEDIVPEGVVLSFRGQRFKLSRPR